MRLAGSGDWYLSALEYGTLLSKYWNGEIIFNSATVNVGSMLGLDTFQNEGLGYDARSLAYSDGTARWYYTKNGSGNALNVWVTFFNKYSAVLITTTEWNWPPTGNPTTGWDMETLVGKAFEKATIPNSWMMSCGLKTYFDGTCRPSCGPVEALGNDGKCH